MWRSIIFAIGLLSAFPAYAVPEEESRCILASAERLPPTPGLEIKDSKAEWSGKETRGVRVYHVRIFVSAAGRQGFYDFSCGAMPNGSPVVVPVQ